MIDHPLKQGARIDVAVIGGGPAGLAAATEARRAGARRVVVLERETQAGGIPRHCGHPPFGLREFRRILRGPAYAARLVARARQAGVEIHTGTTVVEARPGGELLLAVAQGLMEIAPRRVIYATGVREASRAARLISGARVAGVLNTGALQSMVYLKHRRPFRNPVIVGSELVSFSALLTCRHAGIRPVAMIERHARTTAPWPASLFPRMMGVKLLTGTTLEAILGEERVQGVRLRGQDGRLIRLDCDGVILSGEFTPEATLARMGHLELDPATGGPVVDQWGRCSDPVYFATGNLLRPVETAGWSWAEGCRTGRWVVADLQGALPEPGRALRLVPHDERLKYVMPQKIVLPRTSSGMDSLQLRVAAPVRGELVARDGNGIFWHGRINARPERRILIPIADLAGAREGGTARLEIRDAGTGGRLH